MLEYTASRAEIGVLAPEHAGTRGVQLFASITNARHSTSTKVSDVGGYGWCCAT